MRHRVHGNQLGRRTNTAKALYRSLVFALLSHGRIETSVPKAKAVRSLVDKIIALSKSDTPANRRRINSLLGTEQLSKMLFAEMGPRFASRTSGYTRIIKLGRRFSDQAEMAIFELVEQGAPVVTGEVVKSESKKADTTEVVEGEEVAEAPKKAKAPAKKAKTVKKVAKK